MRRWPEGEEWHHKLLGEGGELNTQGIIGIVVVVIVVIVLLLLLGVI